MFSWVEYPSKDVRDAANKKMREESRMKEWGEAMKFVYGKRMVFGEIRADYGRESMMLHGCGRRTIMKAVMSVDEVIIQEMLDEWASAVRAHDLEAVLRHHSMDIVMYDVPEPLQARGIDAYRDTWNLYFNSEGSRLFELQEARIVAGDDVAFVHTLLLHHGAGAGGEAHDGSSEDRGRLGCRA